MGWLRSLFGGSGSDQRVLNSLDILAVDMHNHILPGIDDGAPTPDVSVEMVQHLQGLGYRKLICTPHIMRGGYDNTPETIHAAADRLRSALDEASVDMPIECAAEYYLDETFQDRIAAGDLLCFGRDRFVLFELSYLIEPANLEASLTDLFHAGYAPVLAHPERYPFLMTRDGERYRDLHDRGVHFQLNLFSLAGAYGRGAREAAELLIDHELVDFVGTDLHNPTQFAQLEASLHRPYAAKLCDLDLLNASLDS